MKYYVLIIIATFTLRSPQFLAQGIERKSYYDQDKEIIKEHYTVLDTIENVLHGSYTSYFLSGGVKSRGFYKNNVPDSLWEYYYENGSIRLRGTLKDNINFGKWEYYYENGNKSREGNLKGFSMQGEWIFYYENGQVKSQGEYIDSKKEGIWNYFYEDGSLKAQAYYESGSGIYKEFYQSGKLKTEGYHQDGKSDSLWVYYHETGEKQAEGQYHAGLKEGLWKFYHENGAMSARGHYETGQQQGMWRYFHDDGSVSSAGRQKDGQKDGYWNFYYETGTLKGEIDYVNGEGAYSEYFESGKLKVKGYIRNEQNVGEWFYYYESGDLEGEAFFVEGEGTFKGYYEDGNLKMEGTIRNGKKVGRWKLYHPDGNLAGYYNPVYQEEKPIFMTAENIEEKNGVARVRYEKPEYKFKSRKFKYFESKINEYRGLIFAFNPFATPFGQLPISLEYYWQERLGVEAQYILIRDPFFKGHGSVDVNQNFKTGSKIKIRQKFYHKDGRFGMLYFGHELSISLIDHGANVIDSTGTEMVNRRITANEDRFEYGIFVGDRWVKNTADAGPTIDVYFGIGIGYRQFTKNYEDNPEYDEIFSDVKQDKITFPIIFGVNFGLIRPKKKLSTY